MVSNTSRVRPPDTAGFSLIELLVVMGIFIVVTSVILTSNTRFGGVFSLQNLAYDVGLSIRQAQVYGISVQKTASGTYSSAYGAHFDSTTPTTYLLFADSVSENGLYDVGEVVTTNEIGRGFRIVDLCSTPQGTGEVCGRQRLDIQFKRPEPDAYIRVNAEAAQYQRGRIVLQSPRGDRISVVVGVTGGIFVQK